MKKQKLIATLAISLLVQNASAQLACENVFAKEAVQTLSVADEGKLQRFPDPIEDLKVILPHQTRMFSQKQKPFLVVEAPSEADLKNNPTKEWKDFQESTLEIIITPIRGGGGFRHIVFRAGTRVYDFGTVRQAKAGLDWRRPSDGTDAKGVVFHVGKDRVEEGAKALMAFYKGSNDYNNPPFSSVGGKLVIENNDGNMKFKSEEKVWIPGGKKVNIDNFRNNSSFTGKIVVETDTDGREKKFLENPWGIRIPVSTADDGTLYVNGFSCASSAVYVMKYVFGLNLYESKSAANLVKTLLEGNNDFDTTPDALVLYGPERAKLQAPMEPATNDSSQLSASRAKPAQPAVQASVVQAPAQVEQPVDEVQAPAANMLNTNRFALSTNSPDLPKVQQSYPAVTNDHQRTAPKKWWQKAMGWLGLKK